MRILILIVFIGTLIACNSQSKNEKIDLDLPKQLTETSRENIDTLALGIRLTPEGTYLSAKEYVKRNKNIGASTSSDFEDYMLNHIIPFWYGTPWDFNGYTAIPNEGEIACGYFVSTTLLHAGIKLNRYKLAQQAGLHEAMSLAITDKNYKTTYGLEKLKREIKNNYEDGLYFVGLDNHVGFIYIKNNHPYFIHSNYIEDRVMIEEAYSSDAFQSNVYVIAELSTNEELLEKWRNNEEVKIVTK